MHARLCVFACCCVVASCSRNGEVSRVRPHLSGAPGTGALAIVEQTFTKAMAEERAQPRRALGDCLSGLKQASRELERDPDNAIAIRDYNFGIARIFRILNDTHLDPWHSPLTLPS